MEIQHIIIGNDNIEQIKKQFNEPAFRYIKKEITVASQRKFDIIKSFIQFVIKDSKNYLDGDGLKEDSIYYDQMTSTIKLRNNNEPINLKGVFINSKGIFISNIEPRYSTKIVRNQRGEVFIAIEFEMYGNINDNLKVNGNWGQNQYIITINGKIEDIGNKNENFEGTLKYNEFYFQIIVDKFIPIKNDNNEQETNIKKEYDIIDINLKDIYTIPDTKYGIYKILLPIEYEINEIENDVFSINE